MNISYSQVNSYCNELHALAKNMKETLDNIKAEGEGLVNNGYWEGKASNYYSNKLNKLIKNFDVVYTEIENSILYMAKCSDGYQAVDDVVIGEICSSLNITEPNLSTSEIFG